MRKESIALITTVEGTSPTSFLELTIVKLKYGITRLEHSLIIYFFDNPMLSVSVIICD